LGTSEIDLGFPCKWYDEGEARFLAPIFEATSVGEPKSPAKTPVFYNPYSKLSRDLTVLLLDSLGVHGIIAAEPLGGCGVRGIRLLLETSTVKTVHLNDINTNAVKVMAINTRVNNVADRVEITHGDANIFLAVRSQPEHRFDYVDIDPVGSPSRFIENGLRACRTGGFIGVSATDLASLVGRHPAACLKKYDSLTFSCDFAKEIALRILAGYVVRAGMPSNVAATPRLSIYHRHFIRVFLSVERGRGRCLRLLERLGWLQYCHACLTVRTYGLDEPAGRICPICGRPASIAGPLWLGPLHDQRIISQMGSRDVKYQEAGRLIKKVAEEIETPGFFTVRTLAKRLGLPPVSPQRLVDALRDRRYKASLTHVDPEGFKTDASYEEIAKVMGLLV